MIPEETMRLLERESPSIRSKLHGLSHWRRVERNGLYLSRFTGADPAVIEHFAYLHDCMRTSDGFDLEHGPRAAEFIARRRERIALDAERFETLVRACAGHTAERVTDCPTLGTCWDADRLDLGRAGIERDPKYFFSEEAKRIVAARDDRVLEAFRPGDRP